MAYESIEADAFWIMNDDTMPSEKSLDSLVNSAKCLDKKFGVLCSKVFWRDNSTVNAPDYR